MANKFFELDCSESRNRNCIPHAVTLGRGHIIMFETPRTAFIVLTKLLGHPQPQMYIPCCPNST